MHVGRRPGGALRSRDTQKAHGGLGGAPGAQGKADGVEVAKPPLGGKVRAPSRAVAVPAIGGRPKADTFEGVWRELGAALAATSGSSLGEAVGLFAGLGFTLEKAKDDHAKLTRGAYTLRIEEKHIASHGALAVELEGPARRGGDEVERAAVAMSGHLLPVELWETMKGKYKDVLDDFHDALAARGKEPLPTTFDKLKAFIDGGKSEKARAKDAAKDAEVDAALAKLTAKLEVLKKKGLAPENVIVYTDGPDGAGKSSTGTIVLNALSTAGYTTDAVSFKAPTAAERAQHWLARFEDRGVPSGSGNARFWDRGPAGDAVYGGKVDARKMARELRSFEKELAASGTLLFKVHIFADQEKQAETFGKRFARQAAADIVEGLLEKPSEATLAALDNIRSKVDADDIRALVGFEKYQAAFLRFSKLAGYTVVDASDRHAARLEIIQALSDQLDAFAASRAA